MSVLQFVPFETVVDTAFWHGLADRKLNKYRLSEGPFEISAQFTNSHAAGISPRVTVDITSFNDGSVKRTQSPSSFKILGQLFTLNSLDEFKSLDKQSFLDEHGAKFMNEALLGNEFLRNPVLLLRFLLLTYCDLKKHKFYFWFAYPAVMHSIQPTFTSINSIREEFTEDQAMHILHSYDCWRKKSNSPFFVLKMDPSINVSSLSDFELASSVYVGICDSSVNPMFPCWFLRNLLYSLSATIIQTENSVKILCLRDRFASGQRHWEHSIVIHANLQSTSSNFNQFVGWEKWKCQLKPRVVDLSTSMDPVKLADSAVDLNLKLMKWRLMPDLKLSRFRETKCLLIGAGTLGCIGARQLLAWGVRHITLVDNGTVSFSNPVRQSLYVFTDSVDASRNKAITAAQALKAIFPGVEARGYDICIPMPGHPVSSYLSSDDSELTPSEKSASICRKLDDLVGAHDVLFLLTDTRESRWLPTVLANVHGKLVINAALGFDTYLVMRHGVRSQPMSPCSGDMKDLNSHTASSNPNDADIRNKSSVSETKAVPGSLLGCYFCNDVVGPMNSTRNRSLDQQCTVTRPGVSMIAAALAVELMVSVLQHPLMYNAPADTLSQSYDTNTDGTSLGLIPHQIRGFLSHYTQVLPATLAFSKCSACSQPVLDAYMTNKYDFLQNVFNDASYLEHVCGLRELHDETNTESILMLSDADD